MSAFQIPDPAGTDRPVVTLLEDSVHAQHNFDEERERQLATGS